MRGQAMSSVEQRMGSAWQGLLVCLAAIVFACILSGACATSMAYADEQASADLPDASATETQNDVTLDDEAQGQDAAGDLSLSEGIDGDAAIDADAAVDGVDAAEQTKASAADEQAAVDDEAADEAADESESALEGETNATGNVIAEGPYVIEADSGYVVDVYDGNMNPGANVWAYNENSTPAQRFSLMLNDIDESGNARYLIVNLKSGLALGVSGTNVQTFAVTGEDSQLWTLADFDGTGAYRIVNLATNKSLAIDSSDRCANISVATTSSSLLQKWLLNRVLPTVEEGTYIITSTANTGLVMDVAGGSTAYFADIVANDKSGASSQMFKFVYDEASGYYEIQNANSGQCIDVRNGNLDPCNQMWQYKKNGTLAQKWQIVDNGDGTYSFISAKSGLYLDVANGISATSGAAIWQYAGNGTAAQKFTLKAVGSTSMPEVAPDWSTVTLTDKPLAEGVYTISNSGKVMDMYNGSTEDGGYVWMCADNHTPAQRYNIVAACYSNNQWSYVISNVKSGLALGPSGGQIVQGPTSSTRWNIEEVDGKYRFVDVRTGDYLTLNGVTKWTLTAKGADVADGAYTIVSTLDKAFAVDVKQDSGDKGAGIDAETQDGALSQQFAFNYDAATGYYTITNYGSGYVLDVYDGSTESGGIIWQYTSNNTWAQKWDVVKNSDGTFTLYSAKSGLAIDVCGGTSAESGAVVWQYTPNNSAAQKFKLVSSTPTVTDGVIRIQNGVKQTLVMDVTDGSKTAGTAIELYTWNKTYAQKFMIEENEDGTYSIQMTVSGLYLTAGTDGTVTQQAKDSSLSQAWVIAATNDGHFTLVPSGSTSVVGVASLKSGAALKVAANAKSALWNIVYVPLLESGIYTIQSVANSNLVLDVYDGSVASGGNIWAYTSNDSNAQKFLLTSIGGDKYTISGSWSILNLDVANGTAADGTNVWQVTPNGTAAQTWTITWKDGNFFIKSELGDFNLALASANAQANVQIATANDDDPLQQFMFVPTTMNKATVAELIKVLDTYSTGNALVTFKSPNTLSQETTDAIYAAIQKFTDIGHTVGFTIIDLTTGAGLSYNSDHVYYSACSIKGPYTMALNQYVPDSLSKWEDYMYPALNVSDNATYQSYFYNYGTWPLETYNSIGHVENFRWTSWTAYYTAEDLARMWVVSQDYLLGDTSNAAWLRDVLSHNWGGMTRDGVAEFGVDTVYSKSGWIDFARTEGSLIMAGDHPYVCAIMADCSEYYSYLLTNLSKALYKAHEELIY